MGDVLNVRVEPANVSWGGEDLGFLDGDIEWAPTEDSVDITAHQTGTTIQDSIRTGKKAELKLKLKEVHADQIERMFGAGGATATAVAEVTSITCVADSAGSLNNKYFFINTKGDLIGYYVWFNVNSAGVDPAIAGRTAVPVALATGATATTVATAVAAALDALAGFVTTSSGAVVTNTNATAGGTSDATAENSGFTVAVTTQGIDAVLGWGSGNNFSTQLANSAKLVIHPVRLVASDMSKDITFWKAYPSVEAFNFSGENPQTLDVTFKIFPDPEQPAGVDYFIFGAHL